jgi:hypothetical protein
MAGWTSQMLQEALIANPDLARRNPGEAERLVPRFPVDYVPPAAASGPATPQASKFGNVRTLGPAPWGGEMTFDSAAEAETARDLDLQKRAGAIMGWLPQVLVPIGAGPRGYRRHKVDFLVVENDGRMRLLERKGHDHADGRQRRNDLAAMGVPVEVVS